jgi:two-component system, sensor histidine kinase and response regulator
MTNQAISAIMEHFCIQARNAAQANLLLVELLRGMRLDRAQRVSVRQGTAGADQLLRSIEDVRELLEAAVPPPRNVVEEFDLAQCAAEIVEGLNLASGKKVRQLVMDEPPALPIMQDRRAVEQVLTRVLGAALKLAPSGEVRFRVGAESHMRRASIVCEETLAVRLANWLNADPEQAQFEEPGDLPHGVAVMVAGKWLRALGGAAALDGAAVELDFPSAGADQDTGERKRDALHILVAEDNDESFALTEMIMQEERVWRARDGQEALRLIQTQRFDVVFMDVHMPGMNGYEAIRIVREWETQQGGARTPMVVLSSDDVETQQRSAAECGCSGFLRKPLERADLTPLLERLKQA